jgi:hypothetical protein
MKIKNHILLFQLPGNRPTTKKCAPYFRGNMEFSIYLLATYGICGKYWFSVEKNEIKKIISDFHVLGLFLVEKHDLSVKTNSVCHAPLLLNAKFVPRLQHRP